MDIDELLTRGVGTIYPSKEELEKVLRSGKKLKLYQGFDPTGTQLHLGHMVGFRKLAQWQKLGHHVIFLIGDFTAMVGDPTGKDKARKMLSKEEVLENAKLYKEQASKILDFDGENPIEIKFNSEWLGKMSAVEFTEITNLVSYNQIIERDMFQDRIKRSESIGMTELLYPVMQGYDSVAMDVDMEIGGSDQLFNMMMGNQLMQKLKNKHKFVMTTPLLTDSAGVKIGKTEGNVIGLTDQPSDLFGKIMALPDDVIAKGLEYLTDVPMKEIKEVEQKINSGENPIQYKKKLAFEIIKQLNSEEAARKAQESFGKTVQNKEMPEEVGEVSVIEHTLVDDDLLVKLELATSKSEAKRLFEQGGVEIDGEKVEPGETTEVTNGMVIKVGKRKFVRILVG